MVTDFERWFSNKENQIKKYINAKIFHRYAFVFMLSLTVLLYLIIYLFFQKTYPELINTNLSFLIFYILLGVSIGIVFLLKHFYFYYPMKKKEFLVCLIKKITDILKNYEHKKDFKKLMYYLNAFEKYFEVSVESPLNGLFEKCNQDQKSFFYDLNSIPSRILYNINNNESKKIDIRSLDRLSQSIYLDDLKKLDNLKRFIDTNPDKYKPETLKEKCEKLAKNRTLTIIAIGLILAIIFGSLYFILGFDKDTLLLAYISLLGVIIYVTYKK